MSFLCSSYPPTSGSFLQLSKVASRQFLPFLYPIDCFRASSPRLKRIGRRQSFRSIPSSATEIEAWFLNAITNAGHCPKHRSTCTQPRPFFSSRRPSVQIKNPQTVNTTFQRRKYISDAQQELPDDVEPEPNRTREELLELVDQYTGDSYTDQLPLLELPKLYQPSDGPHLTVSEKLEDEWPPPNYAWPADEETKKKLDDLEAGLKKWSNTPKHIFELYQALPEPRAPYLCAKIRHKMLHHLAVVERKDEVSMLRYMSVLDDMKQAAIPLSVSEWTSALSFVSRYVARSTEVEVEAALTMWREMEHVAGVKGDNATFNVLFDVSCKAGKFTLAEMIYKEMERRGLEWNRYHHTSKIFYYGQKRSGDGARAAYKELIEAGEIVDTVVLNAMISALIKSNEPQAAENVYERMKKAHLERSESQLPPRDYKARREINNTLKAWGKIAKFNKDKRAEYQAKSIIAPDLQTYRILIHYFAVNAGDLERTARLLDEMKYFELHLHGAIFVAVLKGFVAHGGIRYTHWTENRLDNVYKSLLEGLDANSEDLCINRWIGAWVLRAFAKCSGKSRTLAVWEEIRSKWEPSEEDLEYVMESLQKILDSPDVGIRRHDWMLGSMSPKKYL
ncbi:uncharacterized protein PAC_09486 [Phialocephala subalpina]|uniref:Pentatricopeptide repeat protein n=1 Tax=Phialocephala subalpina TaxID=576137 RepID=A0A1L7X3J1_9HELO|nr:uncharacterized protein PAC_09486 [Phialocephala subalpina]